MAPAIPRRPARWTRAPSGAAWSCTSRRPTHCPGSGPAMPRWRRRSVRRSRNSCHRQTRRVESLRNGVTMGPIIFLIVLVVVVGWLIGAYNGLISLKNQTVNAFKQIDVQLKRRHDLIPSRVNAVKGAMDFERSTLEAVIQARNQAVKVNASGPEGIKQISQAENALSSALQRLMVVVEQYPQLKATGNIGQLQEELTSTENKVAFARQLYNDTATQYNTKQQQFPTNLVTGLAKAQPADLWEIEDQADKSVPQVDLSMKPDRKSVV